MAPLCAEQLSVGETEGGARFFAIFHKSGGSFLVKTTLTFLTVRMDKGREKEYNVPKHREAFRVSEQAPIKEFPRLRAGKYQNEEEKKT